MKLKKLLAVIMAALMLVSAVPFVSAAETDTTITEGSEEKADTSGLEKAKAALEEILETEGLIDSVKEKSTIGLHNINVILSHKEEIPKEKQETVDLMVKEVEDFVVLVTAGIADGSCLKADYKGLDAAIALLKELLETPELTEEYKTYIQQAIDLAEATDRNLTQSDEDTAILLSAAFSALVAAQKVKDAIKDGSALKADFTEADAGVKEIEEYIGDEGLSAELTKELEELKARLEELKADPTATQYEVNELIADLESFEESVRAERGSIYYWIWKLIEAVIELFSNLKW